MTAEYKFVQVMDALFEPELKLRISTSVPYDAYSKFELRIEHDPEIDAEHLTMPPPGWLVEGWSASNPAPPPKAVPFRSSKSRLLTTFIGNIEEDFRGLKLVLLHLSSGFISGASKIEQALPDASPGEGFEIIHQLLRAAISLPFWDDQVRLRFRETEGRLPAEAVPLRIELCLEEDLATQLAANSSFSFDDGNQGYVLVAAREVRS